MENKVKSYKLSKKEKTWIMKTVNDLEQVLEGQDTTTLALEYALGILVAHNVKMMTNNLHLKDQEIRFISPIFEIAKTTLEVDGVDLDAQANDLQDGEVIDLRNMN